MRPARQVPGWRDHHQPRAWLNSLERYAFPRIGAVLGWAIAMNYRTDNPCDRIAVVLGHQQHVVQHMRALPHRDVATVIEAVWSIRLSRD